MRMGGSLMNMEDLKDRKEELEFYLERCSDECTYDDFVINHRQLGLKSAETILQLLDYMLKNSASKTKPSKKTRKAKQPKN